MHPNFHCSYFQNMEVAKMSINRGLDKGDVVHIYNGMIFSHLKKI